MGGPTSIASIIKNKPFEQVREILSEYPYFLSVSDEDDMFMLNFTDKSDLKNPVCREANGVIFQKDTNKLLHYSFPKTYEGFNEAEGDSFDCEEVNEFSIVKDGVEIPTKIQLFTEGSLIKVFYHNFSWVISTSHKINASMSFWNSDKSFKELFYEALEEVNFTLENLDHGHCYSFILQHPENFICKDITIPFTSLVNKINLTDFTETNLSSGFFLEKPLSETKDLDVLVYVGNERVKILSNKYIDQKKMIGNNSLKMAYLSALLQGNEQDIRDHLKSQKRYFDSIDLHISNEIELLYDVYVSRHIEKKRMDIYPRHKKMIYKLHGEYLESRIPISQEIVKGMMFSLNARTLSRVIDL